MQMVGELKARTTGCLLASSVRTGSGGSRISEKGGGEGGGGVK